VQEFVAEDAGVELRCRYLYAKTSTEVLLANGKGAPCDKRVIAVVSICKREILLTLHNEVRGKTSTHSCLNSDRF
jgi:hypothetical protein